MSSGSVSSISNELPQVEVEVRPAAGKPSILGSAQSGNNLAARDDSAAPAGAQDTVDVQWDSAEKIVVYQFVNQQGSLILQVPSAEMLNQAQEISKELAEESVPATAAVEGEKNHGS